MPENPSKSNHSYLIYMYKEDLALNNLQYLIYMYKKDLVLCHRTQPKQINTPQGINYTATCLPSRKLSKLDMQDTAREAGTSS